MKAIANSEEAAARKAAAARVANQSSAPSSAAAVPLAAPVNATLPSASPAPSTASGEKMTVPQIAHVCVDRDELNHMMYGEMQPERYYQALRADMRKRHPNASEEMIEHCAIVEEFLDLCLVSGFALGASKTRGRIAQIEF